MNLAALVVGIIGVALYVLSYQFKKRKTIVAMYSAANVMYVMQYILLGAYTGMAMDSLGFVSSLLARKKHTPFMRKYYKIIVLLLDVLMVTSGILLYQNPFSLFAIVAIIVETTALWLDNEKIMRRVAICAVPFWLTYNIAFGAVGSAIGSAINLVSLSTAIFRYDILKKEKAD
ncbi:MAG: YgjV family protein [Oscillospiraceae bacterium]|nr:YgjV family protein [Oscillospiraceae bacterium]